MIASSRIILPTVFPLLIIIKETRLELKFKKEEINLKTIPSSTNQPDPSNSLVSNNDGATRFTALSSPRVRHSPVATKATANLHFFPLHLEPTRSREDASPFGNLRTSLGRDFIRNTRWKALPLPLSPLFSFFLPFFRNLAFGDPWNGPRKERKEVQDGGLNWDSRDTGGEREVERREREIGKKSAFSNASDIPSAASISAASPHRSRFQAWWINDDAFKC